MTEIRKEFAALAMLVQTPRPDGDRPFAPMQLSPELFPIEDNWPTAILPSAAPPGEWSYPFFMALGILFDSSPIPTQRLSAGLADDLRDPDDILQHLHF